MGQMKRLAMQLEDEFYEIASEFVYVAESWDEYRNYMLEHRHLIDHLDIDLEEELYSLWESQ